VCVWCLRPAKVGPQQDTYEGVVLLLQEMMHEPVDLPVDFLASCLAVKGRRIFML
jgi:hypothetical protein